MVKEFIIVRFVINCVLPGLTCEMVFCNEAGERRLFWRFYMGLTPNKSINRERINLKLIDVICGFKVLRYSDELLRIEEIGCLPYVFTSYTLLDL